MEGFMIDLDDRVTAAAIAAAGTVIGTLVQLHITWRKEVRDRARGVPASRKSRRGPVFAVGLLLAGAGVGGFAFSQYLMRQSDLDSAVIRGQLQAQLAQMNATAARLERAVQVDHAAASRIADDRRRAEDTAATATIGACRSRTGAAADATPCEELDAERVTLCASVPASAAVTSTALFARPEGSTQPWTDSRVEPGQSAGHVRFADKIVERSESDEAKQVCIDFASWDGEHAYAARLVVTFATPAVGHEVQGAAFVPVSAASN
jgi:hypothetical protein